MAVNDSGPPFTEEEYLELARQHRKNGGRIPTHEEQNLLLQTLEESHEQPTKHYRP